MKQKKFKELNNDPTFNYWRTDTQTDTDRDSYFADTWGIALPPPELGQGQRMRSTHCFGLKDKTGFTD